MLWGGGLSLSPEGAEFLGEGGVCDLQRVIFTSIKSKLGQPSSICKSSTPSCLCSVGKNLGHLAPGISHHHLMCSSSCLSIPCDHGAGCVPAEQASAVVTTPIGP